MTLTPAWTLFEADDFLKRIADDLFNLGVTAQVVGSVARQGFSNNDLDLLLTPLLPMSLEDIIDAVEARLLPKISTDSHVNPLESAHHDNVWFLNIALKDHRIVELYLPESTFPVEGM
ncbi:hypothetical protein [Pseudomonas sp. NPDC096950]|uniref:hypothetical protein n=1 Tax=Pseudomonas sp. NPDC096950 TaxID=3364485 RepID=UPI00383AE0AC